MKKQEKWIWRLSPPGYDYVHERNNLVGSAVIAAAVAMLWFAFSLSTKIDDFECYYGMGGSNGYGDIYVAYTDVMSWGFSLFAVPAIMSLANILYRRAYFFRDSRSIYTIRRLSSRNEFWIRILVVPILEFVLTVAAVMCLIFITWLLYLAITPAKAIPDWTGTVLLQELLHWWHL